jgi:uncharacterized membrane protein
MMTWNNLMNWDSCCVPGPGMGFGGLLFLAFLGLLLWAGYILLRRTPASSHGGSALETLRQRHASGELSREEFESMRRAIIA